MFSHLSDTYKAAIFFVVAISLSTIAVLLIHGEAVVFVHMFTPTIAALILLFVVTRDGYTAAGRSSLGVQRLGIRSWGLALLLPLPVFLFSYGLVWSMGIADFVVPSGALGSLPLSLFIGIVSSTLLALGEEIGFRGYLVPRLMHLGPQRAILLAGLLHAIWHVPILVLTGFYQGNLLIALPLFLLTLTAAGVVYGYLRITTDSVWPAAVLHGAWNAFWGVFAAFTVAASPLATEYLAGESGLLTFMGVAVVAGWLLLHLRQRAPVLAAPA